MKVAETPAGAGSDPNLMNLVEERKTYETNGLKLRKQQELGMEDEPIFHSEFQKHGKTPVVFLGRQLIIEMDEESADDCFS